MRPDVGWAQRVVRRQLDTLRRLASVASHMVGYAMHQVAPVSAGSRLTGLGALEKALRLHGKVAWALRLIDALRVKLANDLQRLERGDAPELILAAETSNEHETVSRSPETGAERAAPEKAERGDASERERGDGLGRLLRDDGFADILKRPTDEIIALICRELGLDSDWPHRVEDVWEADMPVEVEPRLPSPWTGKGFGDGGGVLSGKPPSG